MGCMISTKLCECGCGEYTNIVSQTNISQGRIKGEPSRFISGHHGRMESKPYGNKIGTIRPAIEPTEVDVAWAAGFLEGEGSFREYRGTQEVTASQVEIEPLEKLQKMFGGSIRLYKKEVGRPIHRWSVTGQLARDAMIVLYPFLYSKRQKQVEKAMGEWGLNPIEREANLLPPTVRYLAAPTPFSSSVTESFLVGTEVDTSPGM